jgi:hypothetical protein
LKEFDDDESKNTFANLKKMIIQEKGEEDYRYLHNKKKKMLDDLIEDRIIKENLIYKLDYYNNEQ